MRRLPSSFRWTPLLVSGVLAAAKSALLGAKRSTNRTSARRRHLRHGEGIHLEPGVVLAAVGQIRVAQVLVRDRREQHEARRGLAVVLLRQRVRDPVLELLPECRQPGVAAVRLVVAEEREDHVRLGVGVLQAVLLVAADRLGVSAQPLVGRAEVLRAKTGRDLVAREPQVADDQVVARKARVQQRIEPALGTCSRSASWLPMMAMCSPARSTNGVAASGRAGVSVITAAAATRDSQRRMVLVMESIRSWKGLLPGDAVHRRRMERRSPLGRAGAAAGVRRQLLDLRRGHPDLAVLVLRRHRARDAGFHLGRARFAGLLRHRRSSGRSTRPSRRWPSAPAARPGIRGHPPASGSTSRRRACPRASARPHAPGTRTRRSTPRARQNVWLSCVDSPRCRHCTSAGRRSAGRRSVVGVSGPWVSRVP